MVVVHHNGMCCGCHLGIAIKVSVQLNSMLFMAGADLIKWPVADIWHKIIRENLHSAVCTPVKMVSHVTTGKALFQQLFSEPLLYKQ